MRLRSLLRTASALNPATALPVLLPANEMMAGAIFRLVAAMPGPDLSLALDYLRYWDSPHRY